MQCWKCRECKEGCPVQIAGSMLCIQDKGVYYEKLLCMICVLLVVLAMAGCAPSVAVPETDPTGTEAPTLPPEIKKIVVEVSWVIYGTLEELIDEAGNIFEGEVTNISFGIFNKQTGKPVMPGWMTSKTTCCIPSMKWRLPIPIRARTEPPYPYAYPVVLRSIGKKNRS